MPARAESRLLAEGKTADCSSGDGVSYHGGTVRERGRAYRTIEFFTPSIVKAGVKSVRKRAIRFWNRRRYLEAGRFVEFGRRFRFDRRAPHVARVGERSIAEDYNVWNSGYGDIVVGRDCWFGLHNVVMGPLRIGDRLSTGPFVAILGPRHPTFDSSVKNPPRTVIGDDVWISTGAIILSGAVIGDGAVICAGAVVAGRVPPNSTYVENRTPHLIPRFP